MLPLVLLLDVGPAQPSAFWSQADALCPKVADIQRAPADKLGAHAAARDELVLYCRFSIAPAFAARGEAERSAALAAIASAADLSLPPPKEVPVTEAATAWLVRAAEQQMKLDPAPELGLVGEKILGAALSGLCATADAKHVLAATCSLGDAPSLGAFRLAVVRDVVDLFVKRSAESAPPLVRLLALVVTHDGLRTAAPQLTSLVAPPPCDAPICAAAQQSARAATATVVRALADGPVLDRDKDHYRNIAREAMRAETGSSQYELSPAAAAATDALVAALRALDDEQRRAAHPSPTAAAEKLLSALEKAALLAWALVVDRAPNEAASAERLFAPRIAAAQAVSSIATRIAHAEASGVLAAARGALDDMAEKAQITAGELRALTVASRLAEARTEADLKRAARDALLPLPPWVDRVVFDINVAPPVNKQAHGDSQLSLNGDITLGYNGDHLGFVAHADSAYYEIAQERNYALTERYAGSLDLWGLIDVSPAVRIEPRLSAGANYYGTLADDATTTTDRQTNQDSIFGRGVASLGVRVQPGSRFAISGSFGAGGQYEDYFRVVQTSNGDQGTTFDAATTVRFEGRLRAQVTIVPQVLSFRARGDVNFFDMRRADQAVTYSLGRTTRLEQGVTEISQTEIFARGFLDADVARFFGFVPAVHGGVNAFLLSQGGASTSAVVPVFGIGIRREAL